MVIGITLFVIIVLIITIWVFIELKRFRHKIFAIFLICLVLFLYLSFNAVFKGKEINLKNIPGITAATKIYFSWLGSIFGNLKTITANAIQMDWKGNQTIG